MENLRNRIDVWLVSNEKAYSKGHQNQVITKLYMSQKMLGNDFVEIRKK